MRRLFDNPFSPFARKVRLVLATKRLPFESVDALALAHHAELLRVNPRAEVPTLEDDGFVVVGSADIVAYLEDLHPAPTVFPATPRARARARAWERFCDGVFDAIVHDISIWTWPTHRRQDAAPAGLLEAGRRDLAEIAARVEASLGEEGFLCGDQPTIADFALFPHVSSLKPLGVLLDEIAHPRLLAWNRRMRELAAVREDLAHLKTMALERFGRGDSPYEGVKIVWRGDRLEWLFANGFHAWWAEELHAGRAVVPSWRGEAR
ncbi:glutathione S-transferase family protein [Myxococcota bacterium]|nr:glutathione S-transferase family protein [Myxococcota bacterium]MCZ7616826.1 glutathione S-transferase family protein [Myxococcota bacterium]